MRRLAPRAVFARYAVAWIFLGLFTLTDLVYSVRPAHDRAAAVSWASTSVHNLHHHPIGALITSAFIPQETAWAWPALIALALFGANRALGNWRTAVVCAAGQVIGTLVSEGIVAYRVAHGLLPAADRYLIDVGPSYVVMSAIVIALLLGSWPARAAALTDLVLLVAVGNVFGGLSKLQVSAVGHATAMAVAAMGTGAVAWHRHRRQSAAGGPDDAPRGQSSQRGNFYAERDSPAGQAAPPDSAAPGEPGSATGHSSPADPRSG
jgi:hypothetical protein